MMYGMTYDIGEMDFTRRNSFSFFAFFAGFCGAGSEETGIEAVSFWAFMTAPQFL
jgi:hypothetical protein